MTEPRPRLLDLFCGAGGAAMGYHRAGFDVVGVDINKQPRYPFEFYQSDISLWPDYFATERPGSLVTFACMRIDAIHASPPCQAYSALQHLTTAQHPQLVPSTRRLLNSTGLPWVMENVPGAPMDGFVTLCGSMFGLHAFRGDRRYQLRRHRLFELSWGPELTPPCSHTDDPVIGVYGTGDGGGGRGGGGGGFKGSFADRKAAMGIDWMTREELSQAIPPAYTEWIGNRLLSRISQKVAMAWPAVMYHDE